MSSFFTKRAVTLLAFAASICLSVSMLAAYWAAHRIGIDFSVYWRTANRPISAAYELRASYPFPYPPTTLLWIWPLKLVPLPTAFIAWSASSAFAFILVCRKHLALGPLILAVISPPVVFCLLLGQVSVAIAALILWVFTTNSRIGAGIALGIVASVKPQLVVMAPLLLALRADWRAFISAGLSLALIALASLAAFGAQPWLDWISSYDNWRAFLTDGIIRAAPTPAAVASRFGYPPLPFLLLGTAIGAALVYRCRNLGPVELAAAVGAASLLAAPYALHYDLAILAPFLAISVFQGRILSAFAITAFVPPISLLLAALELARKALGDRVEAGAIPAVVMQAREIGRGQRLSRINRQV